jgi:hypothetical protein
MIDSLDFTFLEERMGRKFDWSVQRIKNAIQRYKQYLYIVSIENKPVSPTSDVDEVWHQHILHTRLYEEHCKKIYGKMLHHQPFSTKELNKKAEAAHLSKLGPIYFGENYPKSTDELVSRECCSDDSECCSTQVTIKAE